MRRLKLFLPLILVSAAGVFLYKGLETDPGKLASPLEGKPLPSFELESVADEKQVISQTDVKGKISLLNVWASWCGACKTEHPFLLKLAQEKAIPIIGLNYRDERSKALLELGKAGDPYVLNIYDPKGRLALDLGVYGAPETYLLDEEGVIHFRYSGTLNEDIWQNQFVPKIDQLRLEKNIAGEQG